MALAPTDCIPAASNADERLCCRSRSDGFCVVSTADGEWLVTDLTKWPLSDSDSESPGEGAGGGAEGGGSGAAGGAGGGFIAGEKGERRVVCEKGAPAPADVW